jgi:hemoglobin
MRTLFDRVGGKRALLAAVAVFQHRAVADPRTRRICRNVDLYAQAQRQILFLSWALGAPGKYQARDLLEALAFGTLQPTHEQLDALFAHLEAALEELELDPELVLEAMFALLRRRMQVFGH